MFKKSIQFHTSSHPLSHFSVLLMNCGFPIFFFFFYQRRSLFNYSYCAYSVCDCCLDFNFLSIIFIYFLLLFTCSLEVW